jgi:phosphate transport system protein
MVEHTMRAFDIDLQDLKREILEMGSRTQEQIVNAIDALLTRNIELAHQVKMADEAIDGLQQEIETKAIGTIARRQPVGSDLREIVGALRIPNDLERIADLAVNIAKRVSLLGDEAWPKEVTLGLKRMEKLVVQQIRYVLDSYTRHDTNEALEVWQKDQEIDALNTAMFRELLTYMMEDPRNISFCTNLIFCAKNIERMGDHVTNIAESVYYVVQGSVISGERPKADVINIRTANGS